MLPGLLFGGNRFKVISHRIRGDVRKQFVTQYVVVIWNGQPKTEFKAVQ